MGLGLKALLQLSMLQKITPTIDCIQSDFSPFGTWLIVLILNSRSNAEKNHFFCFILSKGFFFGRQSYGILV